MPTNNQTTLITSMNKAIVRAKKLGSFNPAIINIYEIIKYYIEWTDQQIALGYSGMISDNLALKKLLRDLKYKYPSIICNYKNIVPSLISNNPTENTAPTVDDNNVYLGEEFLYQFKLSDFLLNFADAENHLWKYLLIIPTNIQYGQILIEEYEDILDSSSDTANQDNSTVYTEITGNYQIDIQNLAPTTVLNLYFRRTTRSAFPGADILNFRVSDDPINYLYSTIQTINIYADEDPLNNLPIDVLGDNTIYRDNRAVTVLTLFMFVEGLQAPYNDPEADLIDAIKIIDISGANRGTFLINGSPITVGLIITREEIEAGAFTHVAPDQDAISSDVFEFDARDEGNGQWIN